LHHRADIRFLAGYFELLLTFPRIFVLMFRLEPGLAQPRARRDITVPPRIAPSLPLAVSVSRARYA
jgi:hypothetical protein